MAKIGIIGKGNIGSVLEKRLLCRGHEVQFTTDSKQVYVNNRPRGDINEYEHFLQHTDAVCLTIPTHDDGSTAYKYLKPITDMNKPVITCEKGALSNFFGDLNENLPLIGYSATVGGGTRLLHYARERMSQDVEAIHAVLNGTLNFVFDEVASGRSLGEVVQEAKRLGYAEPGAASPVNIIAQEAYSDVPMKTAILMNILGLGEVQAKNFMKAEVTSKMINQLQREAKKRRYIISITKDAQEEDVIAGFKTRAGPWNISAGFKNIDENPLYTRLIPSGVNNALMMYEGEYGVNGTYLLSGQGAGAYPTTTAMLLDLEQLLA